MWNAFQLLVHQNAARGAVFNQLLHAFSMCQKQSSASSELITQEALVLQEKKGEGEQEPPF